MDDMFDRLENEMIELADGAVKLNIYEHFWVFVSVVATVASVICGFNSTIYPKIVMVSLVALDLKMLMVMLAYTAQGLNSTTVINPDTVPRILFATFLLSLTKYTLIGSVFVTICVGYLIACFDHFWYCISSNPLVEFVLYNTYAYSDDDKQNYKKQDRFNNALYSTASCILMIFTVYFVNASTSILLYGGAFK
ncbi:hypothetical protein YASMINEVIRUS_1280 [Yasminevirus sp. GU-2018]|uniref:Uncharacterized protein n=1 Tax=Yasminevirus sp. GU-2018 TaxID=2420051 RepID=A0A5K0U9Q5_9VIRU|nr:hypothetical protein YASMINEVIRUS_1280 [Yasminevirus sp. GU-2018]